MRALPIPPTFLVVGSTHILLPFELAKCEVWRLSFQVSRFERPNAKVKRLR